LLETNELTDPSKLVTPMKKIQMHNYEAFLEIFLWRQEHLSSSDIILLEKKQPNTKQISDPNLNNLSNWKL
jgi:hypothetical protein